MSAAQETGIDTSDSPKQQIKRPAFVYGKRSNLLRDIPSPPAFTSTDDQATFERKDPQTRTAPFQMQRSSPSPSIHPSDDESSATPFQFDFKRRMKELDEGFEDTTAPAERILSFKRTPSPSGLLTSAGPSPMKDVQSDPAPLRGSLSPPPSSLPNTFTQEQPPDSPLIPSRRRRVAKRPLSDSEAEEQSNCSVSPVRHAITTPSVRSSSTPPTSGEMPIPNGKSNKAKGKAPVRDVLPLHFTSDNPSDAAIPTKSNRGKRRAAATRPKTKAPTKKEQREAQIESSRIAASRPVELAHTGESKRTLSNFFASLQQKIAMPTPRTELPSDPIERFSSPTDTSKAAAPSHIAFGAPTGLLTAPAAKRPSPNATTIALRAASDDSDDDMPSVSAIIQANEKQKMLNAMKQIALQRATASKTSDGESEDDDLLVVKDDMHTVAREAAAQRRLDKANGSPAKARAKLHALGHRSGRKSDPGKLSEQDLRELAKPSFARMGKSAKEQLSKKQLDQMMIKQHTEKQLQLIKQHEEEWVKGGGRLSRDAQGQGEQASLSQMLGTYAERGLEAAQHGDAMAGIDDEASADESDGDYAPELRGSASPEPMDTEEEDVWNEQGDEMEVLRVLEAPADDDDTVVAPMRRNKSGPRRAVRVVLGSDDEDEGPTSREPIARCQDAGSSMESQTEDENDKENSARLMYDHSEDKENKAVVRHGSSLTEFAFGSRPKSQLGIEDGVRGSLSLAPAADFGDATASPKESLRSPLKDISKDEDDLFASLSLSKSPFTKRLLHCAARSPPRLSASTLSLGSPPVLRSERGRRTSQLQFDSENDENDPSGFKPLQLSFLERLDSQTSLEPSLAPVNPLPNGGLSQLFASEDRNSKADNDELSLTLDVGLKPALEVSGTLRRKAETIFEKEQEYVVAAAAQSTDRPKEVIYVNDHGFLTQTRPESSSPGIYRIPPSQASKFIGTQAQTQSLSERPPLRTLSFIATQDSSPEPQPLRRLRRRSASPLEHKGHGGNSNPIAVPALPIAGSPPNLNAFPVLGKGPKPNSKAAHKEKEKLEKSEFVAAEAEESDEDDMFGFGIKNKDDDVDDDGDDQDKDVEGLVDDAVMDAEAEAAHLVQEKYREHEEDDDQKLQQLHQDAVEGKFRTKRRDRGVGFEDDSDDDDDDEARLIRRKIHKKRKIESDSLEALGQNEETRAFYNTYHQDLIDDDDDNDFAHLREGPVMPKDKDDQSEELEEPETVTIDEIRQRAREVAQNNIQVEAMDPEDTSWIDQAMAIEDDEGGVRVKVMQHRTSRPMARLPNVGQVDFEGERPKRQGESEQQRKQWTSWAKGQSHRQGTGRSGTGAAVTGHSRIKGGNGSLRSSQASSSGSVSQGRSKANSKAPSLLSTVSNRSGRFA